MSNIPMEGLAEYLKQCAGWTNDSARVFQWVSEVEAAQAAMAGAEPVAWAIFDSQGFYDIRETENQARWFCDRYNKREVDPLKPYTWAPLFAHPAKK